jgi:hypothetical protein
MAASSIVNAQQRLALEEIRAICEELDPEAASQLNRYMPGNVMPNPDKRPAEHGLFMAEAMLILARAVRGKKRGRPKNVVFHDDRESKAS